MSFFLSVDPGISTGWATWGLGGQLLDCGAGELPGMEPPEVVLIELPQVYSSRHSKGDPNNLITLAVRVGRYTERFEARGVRVDLVHPHTWKGNIQKTVHHARIYRDIDGLARIVINRVSSSLSNKAKEDMYDAIGLGMYAFKMGIFKCR